MRIFSLEGKNALIIGGAGDLGFAVTLGYLSAGIEKVAIIDRKAFNEKQIKDLQDWKGRYKVTLADITESEARKSAFEDSLSFLDWTLDVAFNAAGIQIRESTLKFPLTDFRKVISSNLEQVFEFMQLSANVMMKQKSGRIINISSIMGRLGGEKIPAYAASKGGVHQLTRAFCNEVSSFGITVNSIAPGYFKTALNDALIGDENRVKKILERVPLGRWGTPIEMQGISIFLASEASSYITGAEITVDGGYTCT